METITKWNRWANAHTNLFTDALRLLFGAFIFIKGIFFLDQTEYLYNLFRTVSDQGTYFVLVHYVALAHLCGGFFIMLGLMTRWCAVLQLPILLGAVLINFIGEMHAGNLLQASLGFLVCCFFVYYGSGRHSVDYSLKLHV
jgi:putative oxidoreductase